MAEVYLATHLNLERPVAVKLLHSHIEEEPALLERFHREAKVVAGLRHHNIVQIHDFDTSDGHPYIVMEYLKGPTLSSYLRALHERNERIPQHQVARLLKALTDALARRTALMAETAPRLIALFEHVARARKGIALSAATREGLCSVAFGSSPARDIQCPRKE